MSRTVDADYLVVGAGAIGMAFTDALIDHADRARVAIIDRRHGVGGHWLEAYPFVRLHQASLFYGVASTPLGNGLVQRRGPESGLHERASKFEVCAYYERILHDRFLESDRVEFFRLVSIWATESSCHVSPANNLKSLSGVALSMRTISLRTFPRRPARRSKSLRMLE